MSYFHTQPHFGPTETPALIRFLLIAFSAAGIAIGVVTHLFGHWLELLAPAPLFSLSLAGIKHLFVWQLLSFPFVVPSTLTVFFLVYLGFTLYLIWSVGTAVLNRVGSGPLLRLLCLSTLLAGLAALAVLALSPPFTFLAGAMPVCLALLTAWTMLYPERELLLFFALPIRTKWAILTFLGINFLMDMGSSNYASLAADLAATLGAYLYATLAWNTHSPFEKLRPLDERLARLGTRTRQLVHRRLANQATSNVRALRMQEALNVILEKIASHGMGSLTWRERRLLRRAKRR